MSGGSDDQNRQYMPGSVWARKKLPMIGLMFVRDELCYLSWASFQPVSQKLGEFL